MNYKKAVKYNLLSIFVFTSIIHPTKSPGKQSEYIVFNIQKDSFSILTWNVFMLPKIASLSKEIGNTKLEERAKEIAEYLYHSEYDIIVLQEVFNKKGYKILKEKLKSKYPYISDPCNDNHLIKTNSGLVLFSMFPIDNFKSLKFSDCSSSDCLSNKGAFVAGFTINHRNFRIIGTHLQSDYSNMSEYATIRVKQLKQIVDGFKINLNDHHFTNIFCGDFNISKNDTTQYDYLLRSLQSTNFETSCCNYTWQDYYLRKNEKHIYDYCLVNQEDMKDHIEQRILFNTNNKFRIKPSDHFPVELKLNLANEKLLTQNSVN